MEDRVFDRADAERPDADRAGNDAWRSIRG